MLLWPNAFVEVQMGTLGDLVVRDAIAGRFVASSKRQALQQLTELLCPLVEVDQRAAFEAAMMRERLSGTGVGEGAAIPHARVAGLDRPVAGFARFDPPVDFDAMDGRPADLVFLLLTPADRSGDHLKALARVARFLRRAEIRDALRAARGPEDLAAIFYAKAESDAA
jgi:PTS system nitrogen regulatory IIA component